MLIKDGAEAMQKSSRDSTSLMLAAKKPRSFIFYIKEKRF
jgi:hypothetical protein